MDFDIESSYGVPSGNRIPVFFNSFDNPIVANLDKAESVSASVITTAPRVNVGQGTYSISGSLFLYGNNSNTTPAWMHLLRICNFKLTNDNQFPLLQSSGIDGESATVRTFLDGPLHTAYGTRGLAQISGNAGGVPTVQFGLTGIYSSPDTSPLPTTPLEAPLFGKACGLNFTVDIEGVGVITPIIKSFSLDFGGSLAFSIPANSSGRVGRIFSNDTRIPQWDCVIEVNSTDKWLQWYSERRNCKLSMQIPTPNGKTIYLSTPDYTAQLYITPSYAVDNSLRVWQLAFELGGIDFIHISQQ
jgi:hypothetical protein